MSAPCPGVGLVAYGMGCLRTGPPLGWWCATARRGWARFDATKTLPHSGGVEWSDPSVLSCCLAWSLVPGRERLPPCPDSSWASACCTDDRCMWRSSSADVLLRFVARAASCTRISDLTVGPSVQLPRLHVATGVAQPPPPFHHCLPGRHRRTAVPPFVTPVSTGRGWA